MLHVLPSPILEKANKNFDFQKAVIWRSKTLFGYQTDWSLHSLSDWTADHPLRQIKIGGWKRRTENEQTNTDILENKHRSLYKQGPDPTKKRSRVNLPHVCFGAFWLVENVWAANHSVPNQCIIIYHRFILEHPDWLKMFEQPIRALRTSAG